MTIDPELVIRKLALIVDDLSTLGALAERKRDEFLRNRFERRSPNACSNASSAA